MRLPCIMPYPLLVLSSGSPFRRDLPEYLDVILPHGTI